ncbi:MAG: excinuclease ABC subunit UvrC [Candidatus Omnitrophica bacterium]|nr:excinuclease ABC subunit UvrC [Candidatus Omnitrophota bacterium]MDD5311005.1 excinuclease ABC subunit UvrC [Candidatus Omnitrophota bacterium]
MDIKEKLRAPVLMKFTEFLRDIPDQPGVYIFKGVSGEILYVGKASSLRDRVRSYFQRSKDHGPRIGALVKNISGIDWVPTATEAEALLYESNLIKEHQPKYNVDLRDSKTYPLIKITMAEEFPRVMTARGRKSDGSLYFGPYTDAALLRAAIKSIRKVFPFCTCPSLPWKRGACRPIPKKACIYHDMGLCPAPSEGKISKEDYLENIKGIILFIEGKKNELVKSLSGKMEQLAAEKKFEEAGKVRDRIEALSEMIAKRPRHDSAVQLGELRSVLGLKEEPKYIEAFDISNIKGEEACGSMVTFSGGRPEKSKYRMFKIREVEGQDDYAMMREVVRRRYAGSLKDKLPKPDLIIIDGGRGHLSAAAQEMKAAGLKGVPIIGIAKTFEHIYTLDKDIPVALPPSSKALQLIQRIRDESHRFAIRYHHILRRKALVGEKRTKRLQRRVSR